MPASMAFLRGVELKRFAEHVDGSFVGDIEPVEDRHQRRFPCAIFANDPVDRARFDGEIDILVGLNGAKGFRNAVQFDC